MVFPLKEEDEGDAMHGVSTLVLWGRRHVWRLYKAYSLTRHTAGTALHRTTASKKQVDVNG